MENNSVVVVGMIETGFLLDHESYDEKFYQFYISIKRESGTFDEIPVIISEKLIDVTKDYINYYAYIRGEFRSYNHHDQDGKTHLYLYLFPTEIIISDTAEYVEEENNITIEGYICKEPVHRKTPLGREISDLLIAVNRSYGKSDYLPCIAWGRNAQYAARKHIGELVKISGRIQSRNYEKNGSIKTAYEVSIIDLK